MSASPTDLPELDPVLAGVYRRGYAIRRRRLVGRLASVAIALQLAVALPVAVHAGGDAGRSRVRLVAPAAGKVDETTTTEVPAVAAESTTTVAPASDAAAPTTTSLVCHNSTDPRCGPFRWTREPAPNQPATLDITWEPEHPRVGEEVTFHLRVRDPDASLFAGGTGPCWGDGTPCLGGARFESCEAYGPWDPPAIVPGDTTFDARHTYAQAGTFKMNVDYDTTNSTCSPLDIYGGQVAGERFITVEPGPSTTTTTTG